MLGNDWQQFKISLIFLGATEQNSVWIIKVN